MADLITNQDILDQESSVLEMVKSFRKIMDQDAAMMCSFPDTDECSQNSL